MNVIGRATATGLSAIAWLERQEHPLARRLSASFGVLEQKLRNSAFARNTSVMLFGTLIGQVLSVLLSPLLTRLYSPEQFSALSVYMSTLNILVVIAALRYDIPIPSARDAAEAANLLGVAVVTLAVTTSCVAVIAQLVPLHALERVSLGSLDHDRLLLPIGFLLLGAYYIMLYYATWDRQFDAISRTRISQGISGPVSQIGLGFLHLGEIGLAIGFVIGQSSGTLLLFDRMVLKRLASLRHISWRAMRDCAWRYRAFPLISSWSSMIDTAGAGQLAYILVAMLYPGPLAGYMFIAERVVARPLQMVSTSLLTVYMAEVGQTMTTNPAMMLRRFLQVSSRQLMFSAAWVLCIDTVCATAFPFLFGRNWGNAVPYLLVISIAYLASSVIASVAHTLQVLRRQATASVWQVGRVMAVIAGFTWCAHLQVSALGAIAAYACIQILACSLLFMLMKLSIERLLPPGLPAAEPA